VQHSTLGSLFLPSLFQVPPSSLPSTFPASSQPLPSTFPAPSQPNETLLRRAQSLQLLSFLAAAGNASAALPPSPARAARRARWEAAYRELTNSRCLLYSYLFFFILRYSSLFFCILLYCSLLPFIALFYH
jgi:hypothetical protein